MKLSERTIQFADTLTLLTEGYTRAGRVAHAEGDLFEAAKNFTLATEGSKTAVASVGLAQVQIKNGKFCLYTDLIINVKYSLDEFAAAIHTLDTLLQQPTMQKSLEATVMLASLRAHPRPGISSADTDKERVRARELFEVVCKALDLHLPTDKPAMRTNGHANGTTTLTRAHRRIAEDIDMHAEVARLWQTEDLGRAKRALREGLRLGEAAQTGRLDPRLLNNLGAIHHFEGDLPEARALYEKALTIATTSELTPTLAEAMSTSMLYNLGRAYEDVGEEGLAKDAYEKLLARHPEYTDGEWPCRLYVISLLMALIAKIRLAHILMGMKQFDTAHDILKQSLTSNQDDLNLRSAYTHFLIQANLLKNARDFVYITLKDFDKHDVYALCAVGYIQYVQARDSREATVADRKKLFKRAAEFFEKALSLDPTCAYAAQGLAIGTAEDSLGTLGGALGPPAADESIKRTKNARDALEVFAKVRESTNEGSVYVNMGHCYFNREEYDRAIESVSFGELVTSKEHADVCHSMRPPLNDTTVNGVFQRFCACAAPGLQSQARTSPSPRSIVLLISPSRYVCYGGNDWNAYLVCIGSKGATHTASGQSNLVQHCNDPAKSGSNALLTTSLETHAQRPGTSNRSSHPGAEVSALVIIVVTILSLYHRLFASLAADPARLVPYDKEMADERRKYGDSVLRKADEHLATQRQYDSGVQDKLDAARQRRQLERDRLQDAQVRTILLLRAHIQS